MKLALPFETARSYSSSSQQVRVMTEHWVNNSAFCPNCGRSLTHFENNQPVADFFVGYVMKNMNSNQKGENSGRKL